MSSEPKKPAESLVQELLAERRELKVSLERARMELAEARQGVSGPDPRMKDLISMGHPIGPTGVGQIGAGLVRPPKACFEQAVQAMAAALGR